MDADDCLDPDGCLDDAAWVRWVVLVLVGVNLAWLGVFGWGAVLVGRWLLSR